MKINGKDFTLPKMNFSMLCALEELGVNLGDAGAKPLSFIAACFAAGMGTDILTAKSEIDAHIAQGGDLSEISNEISKEIEGSGFFKAPGGMETA